jgi:hypothetical protein
MEGFQKEYGHPPLEQTRIILFCEHPIHPAAMAVIEESGTKAAKQGVRLELRRSMFAD